MDASSPLSIWAPVETAVMWLGGLIFNLHLRMYKAHNVLKSRWMVSHIFKCECDKNATHSQLQCDIPKVWHHIPSPNERLIKSSFLLLILFIIYDCVLAYFPINKWINPMLFW